VASELARLHGGKYVSQAAEVDGLREQVASLENANLDLASQLQEREAELNHAMAMARPPFPDQTDLQTTESLVVDSTANQVAKMLLSLLFDPEACSMLTILAEQLAVSRRQK